MKRILSIIASVTVLTYSIIFTPLTAQAVDNNITTVTLDAVSDTSPSTTADYTVTFDILFGIGSLNIRFYPIAEDGSIGDDTLSGFSFANTTVTGDALPSNTVTSVSNDTEISIMFDNALNAGTYTVILHDVQNTATEGNYKIGLSGTFNATDDDFTKSDAFTIMTDPCASITTSELSGVTAESFGTNVFVTRGDSDPVAASYVLAYATSQESIDADTGTTTNLTATVATVSDLDSATLYYFQVSAIDSNNCVLARTAVTATTETPLAQQRYTKPTVNNIKQQSAIAHWADNDYVTSYDVQLRSKTKLIKGYRNLTGLKKKFTKQYLNPDKRYYVRVRAEYTTGEVTKWSKLTAFRTR